MVNRPEDLKSWRAASGPPIFFEKPQNPAAYDFNQGIAARETFPTEDLLRLSRKVLETDGPLCLEYLRPQHGPEEMVYGCRGLRERLVERARRVQGVKLKTEGVLLSSGSVQGISLVINGFVDPGDIVAVEAVTFPYAVRYMQAAGADIRPIPLDHRGMNVEVLENLVEQLARENKRLKMVYLGPTFHCPTGAEMPLEARVKLVKLAQRHGFLILEDDVYSDLRFAGETLPTLLSLDDSDLVIQTGTFSKSVVPGIRVGWVMGDPKVVAVAAAVRQDLGVSMWMSRLMEEYLAEDLLEAHIANVNAVYKAKCDAAIEGLTPQRNELIRFETPRGSFYLWVEIDERVDWTKAAAEAERAGIHFRPGERFLPGVVAQTGGETRQFFRMSYSQEPLERVREGASKLGAIIRQSARDRSVSA
jgi:2-aminoadipate transaminase